MFGIAFAIIAIIAAYLLAVYVTLCVAGRWVNRKRQYLVGIICTVGTIAYACGAVWLIAVLSNSTY